MSDPTAELIEQARAAARGQREWDVTYSVADLLDALAAALAAEKRRAETLRDALLVVKHHPAATERITAYVTEVLARAAVETGG